MTDQPINWLTLGSAVLQSRRLAHHCYDNAINQSYQCHNLCYQSSTRATSVITCATSDVSVATVNTQGTSPTMLPGPRNKRSIVATAQHNWEQPLLQDSCHHEWNAGASKATGQGEARGHDKGKNPDELFLLSAATNEGTEWVAISSMSLRYQICKHPHLTQVPQIAITPYSKSNQLSISRCTFNLLNKHFGNPS